MKKKLLTLGLFVAMILGLAKLSPVIGVDLDLSGLTCIRFTTSCGVQSVACGSTTDQLITMVLMMDNLNCP